MGPLRRRNSLSTTDPCREALAVGELGPGLYADTTTTATSAGISGAAAGADESGGGEVHAPTSTTRSLVEWVLLNDDDKDGDGEHDENEDEEDEEGSYETSPTSPRRRGSVSLTEGSDSSNGVHHHHSNSHNNHHHHHHHSHGSHSSHSSHSRSPFTRRLLKLDALVPASSITISPLSSNPGSDPSSPSFRRVSFTKLASVHILHETDNPFPKSKLKEYPTTQSTQRTDPPSIPREQERDVLKKLRQMLGKYNLTYADMLRLALGRFTLSQDLPPYIEDFIDWVMRYRYIDQETGETTKLSWMDRRWLVPVIESTWGVQFKYFPNLYL